MTPGRLVLVEWVDAYASRRQWSDVEDAVDGLDDEYTVHTVGWLMGEGENNLRLCAQVHPYVGFPGEASQVDHVQTIPRAYVRKVTRIG